MIPLVYSAFGRSDATMHATHPILYRYFLVVARACFSRNSANVRAFHEHLLPFLSAPSHWQAIPKWVSGFFAPSFLLMVSTVTIRETRSTLFRDTAPQAHYYFLCQFGHE